MYQIDVAKPLIRYVLLLLLSAGLAGCTGLDQFLNPNGQPVDAKGTAPSTISEQFLVDNNSDVWERLEAGFGVEQKQYTALNIDMTEEGLLSNELWDRIRAGFAFPYHDHPSAYERAHSYADNAEHLDEILQRGEPYLYYVVGEIEKRGMPTEIALLPIIESAYQPSAKSNRGATGIWQFIPSTGRNFGLKKDFWYDGRRDIIASTQAALNYFEKLNGYFDGDWLLTLAAYNCGEGAVMRAMKKNAAAGKPTDFWSLDLPRETEDYVPRLLGVAALVDHPEEFSVNLRHISNTPYLSSIALDKPINLKEAAKIADISHEEIKHLNPGFTNGVTDPKGLHDLLLPTDKVAGFNSKLAELSFSKRLAISNGEKEPTSSKKKGSKKTSGKATTYKVRRGDTLAEIAQRFDTSVAQLLKWNPQQRKTKPLKPGMTLKLYLASN